MTDDKLKQEIEELIDNFPCDENNSWWVFAENLEKFVRQREERAREEGFNAGRESQEDPMWHPEYKYPTFSDYLKSQA